MYYVVETLARQRQEELAAVTRHRFGYPAHPRRHLRLPGRRQATQPAVECRRAAAFSGGSA